jgi:acyl-[acyl-carrier-protein]-phospholipid O-acyltransferase / long-chain-fatty-acid--[acyl-carrier-protein] ligase
VPNHVSWVDAIILSSTLQRFIRFMMFRPFYEFKPTHWFFREAHVIPVAKGDTPERTEASLEQAARELAEGHLVLIFAEGALTRTGDLSRFRRGYRRILDKLPRASRCPSSPSA